jgi:ribonuclease T1
MKDTLAPVKALVALVALVVGLASAPPAWAQRAPLDTVTEVATAELPKEARDTLALIHKGGPYPYAKDGVIFSNREGQLPKQKRGYYHEYTVKTPGERTRGARRIITGSGGEFYYTDDHYNHFRRILE